MKKSNKLAIFSLILIFIGGILLISAFSIINFDMSSFNKITTLSNTTYDIEGDIENINIDIKNGLNDRSNSSVRVLASENGKNYIIYSNDEKFSYSIINKEGDVDIEKIDKRSVSEKLSFIQSSEEYNVDIYLNEKSMENCTLNIMNGDLIFEEDIKVHCINANSSNIRFKNSLSDKIILNLFSSNLFINNFSFNNLEISANSSDIYISNSNIKNIRVSSMDVDIKISDTKFEKVTFSSNNSDVNIFKSTASNMSFTIYDTDTYLSNINIEDVLNIKSDRSDIAIYDIVASYVNIEKTLSTLMYKNVDAKLNIN